MRKESKVEKAKRESRLLRGSIAETLASATPGFGANDAQLLKFHGVYQQVDRDGRGAPAGLDAGSDRWFMVRVKIPGGALSASQYLDLDELADRYAYNRSLRITSRQGLQLHGVVKQRLTETIRGINETLLSTLAACGDVERNVMAPAALGGGIGQEIARDLAARIARALCPATGAYHEIWLDGERVSASEDEPVYGDRYLPRKFKTAVALPEDNSVEVHSQDVGLIALVDGGSLLGANVLVGGGLGLTHRKADTFARLGTPLGRVGSDDVVEIVRVIAEIFRDHGNRADRRHARLKYLIEDWGMDRFRREVRKRARFELLPWRELPPLHVPDHLGSHAQADGRYTYGVPIANGRIIDGEKVRLKTALRKIVEAFAPEIVLTPRQDLVFKGLAPAQVEKIEATLAAFGVELPGALSSARRFALACPALPTCGLALSEAERAMPAVLEEIEAALRDLDLDDAPVSVRMTGCPNGCARPYTSDIGFVGRRPGVYDIFVGGTLRGDRLADRYAQEVRVDQLVSTLTPLLNEWRRERREGEALGDFYRRRHGRGEERTILTGAEPPVLTGAGTCG